MIFGNVCDCYGSLKVYATYRTGNIFYHRLKGRERNEQVIHAIAPHGVLMYCGPL